MQEKGEGASPFKLGSLDTAVKEGREGRRAGKEAGLGRPGTSLFPL